MMMKSFRNATRLFILFSILHTQISILSAQQKTGDVGDEQVTVVKAYLPTLSDAIKISDVPQRDTSAFTPADMNYLIESQKLESNYNITPIKPVKIKDENIKKLYRGFVKGGYGNYNTPYGEIFYNAIRSKEFDAGVHFKHLSSTGEIEDYGYSGFSENKIDLLGKKYFASSVLTANISYDRDVVHYYGFNPTIDGLKDKQETRHRMGTVSGNFNIASSHNSKSLLDYKAEIGFYGFSDNLEQSETDFKLGGMIGKHLDNGHYLKADFTLNPSNSEFPGNYCPPGAACILIFVEPITVKRTLFRLEPRYEFVKDNLIISAGGNVVVESAYDESKWHFYPFASIKYPLIKNEMSVFGELSGNLNKNSTRSLNADNPFLFPDVAVGNIFLLNTDNKFNLKAGIEVKPDRELQISAWAMYSKLNDDVFYMNSLNTSGITDYSVAYFNNSQFNIHAEAQYRSGTKLGFEFKADYFSYSVPDSLQPWFKPDFVFSLGGNYNIADKIFAKVEMFYTGSRTAVSIDGKGTSLKPYLDLNLGVDYRYSKRISVFVHLNNLTATRYYIWYNYPSYKLNAMVGASFSF